MGKVVKKGGDEHQGAHEQLYGCAFGQGMAGTARGKVEEGVGG